MISEVCMLRAGEMVLCEAAVARFIIIKELPVATGH